MATCLRPVGRTCRGFPVPLRRQPYSRRPRRPSPHRPGRLRSPRYHPRRVHPMTSAFLGVDIGTSSSKGVLVRPHGTVIARAARTHGVSTPRPGWVAHDAERIWWAEFQAIIRELLDASDGATLDALAVS